jgi:hypothetical protein
MFMDKTKIKMAIPEKVLTHQASNINSLPSATILPQEAVGGCTPNPKKERLDSRIITVAILVVATTITGERILGRISRSIM